MAIKKESVIKNIGNNVKVLRERANISQQKLANFLEVDLNFVISLENGEKTLSSVKLERISELFGCPSDFLLKEEVPTELFDYAFHLKETHDMDLEAIAAINRVALNLLEMQRLQIVGDQFEKNIEVNL